MSAERVLYVEAEIEVDHSREPEILSAAREARECASFDGYEWKPESDEEVLAELLVWSSPASSASDYGLAIEEVAWEGRTMTARALIEDEALFASECGAEEEETSASRYAAALLGEAPVTPGVTFVSVRAYITGGPER